MPVFNFPAQGGSGDNGDQPPPTDDMEARIAKLEAALPQMQQDVAIIKSNYATKEDIARLETQISRMETRMVKWVIGALAGSLAAAIGNAINMAKLFIW